MDQTPQDTNYVIDPPDTSSQAASETTAGTAKETFEREAREAREAAEREAGRKRVEDAINSGMADIG